MPATVPGTWGRGGLALAAVAGVAVLAAVVAFVLRAGHPTTPAADSPTTATVATAATANDKSIAVLPFVDMSQARDQEYFADGMSEQILDLLAKIPGLKVIARTSSFQFKGKSEDVRTVAEKLGVATVLEGSVRKAGDRLRITAQLIRAADGSHLWSEVYDRQVSDVFRTQDEIADAVVSALKISLLGAPVARAAPTSNTEAYALYLQGLSYSQRYTQADSTRATQYFQGARWRWTRTSHRHGRRWPARTVGSWCSAWTTALLRGTGSSHRESPARPTAPSPSIRSSQMPILRGQIWSSWTMTWQPPSAN